MIQYRGINIEHIKSAIREPDWTKPTLEGKMKVYKQIELGRAIQVVYYKDGFRDSNDFIVITAYYSGNR